MTISSITKLTTKGFRIGVRVFALSAMLSLSLAASAQIFVHTVGQTSTTLKNGKQDVHELVKIVYALPGEQVTLHRPDYNVFRFYIRWYDYQTDAAAANLTVPSQAADYSTSAGLFYANRQQELSAKYTMPSDGQVHYIACDQAAYNDASFSGTGSSLVITEATLSQRIVFEIHPASEIASSVDACTGTTYLETYNIYAPTGNQLFLGTKYPFLTVNDNSKSARANYFYNELSPILMAASTGASTTTYSTTGSETLSSQNEEKGTAVCTNTTTTTKYYYNGSEKTLNNNGTTYKSNNNYSDANKWKRVVTEVKTYKREDVNTEVYTTSGLKIVNTTGNSKWIWKDNGAAANPTIASGQFANFSSSSAGTHTYTLQYQTSSLTIETTPQKKTRTVADTDTYTWTVTKTTTTTASTVTSTGNGNNKTYTITWNNSGTSTTSNSGVTETPSSSEDITWTATGAASNVNVPAKTYNVAKFNVTYLPKTTVGPSASSLTNEASIVKNSTLVTESRFNFTGSYNTPSDASIHYYPKPFSSSESSYGFFSCNSSLGHWSTHPEPSEYAFLNTTKPVNWCGSSTYLTNHTLAGDKSSDGYFLYVDGSQQPNDLFNLHFSADLCPGAKMYFSAYVGDVSTQSQALPNLDFILTGVDADGNEHEIAIYTTGEFGGATDGRSKWLHILFPFEFGGTIDFTSYNLKVTNKGKNGTGNDFVIDDIQIYVENPPITPIQASTLGCPDNTGAMDTYAYLRVDYGAFDDYSNKYYYQWRDYNNQILQLDYCNGSKNYGLINIDANPASTSRVYSDLVAFDTYAQGQHTPTAVYGYINEECADGQYRYVLYIAQPITLQVNYSYYGYVASAVGDLGPDNNCASFAQLTVASGVTFKLGENVIMNGQSMAICGANPGTLQMVYRYIKQNVSSGSLQMVELTDVTADWLYGNEDFVNANPDMYFGYSFAEIYDAILAYRDGSATKAQRRLFNSLVKSSLLTENASSIEPVVIGIGSADVIYYTAFPIVTSISSQVDEEVRCANPSTFSFNLEGTGTNSVNVVRDGDDDLPTYVKLNPRRIRISENTITDGVPVTSDIRLTGEADQAYVCEYAVLVSTTNPAAKALISNKRLSVSFTGNADAHLINNNTESMSLSGFDGLAAGYDYTFKLEKTNHSSYTPANECNNFNTFFTFRIVPAIVTWEGTDGDSWNNDGNWDSFAPLSDTKVVLHSDDYLIPDNASTSTQRESTYEDGAASYITYDINYETFSCADIYIPAGATLVNQHRLTINGKAYFDLPLTGGKWTLSSFPIQGVVAGDLFIPTSENDGASQPFNVAKMNQTEGMDATDRTENKMYASLFNQKAQLVGGSQKELTSASFTGAINNVSQEFAIGMGTSIKADFTGQKVIRLPKNNDSYHYYQYGAWLSMHDDISRDANYGKPAYQPTGADGVNGMDITLTNNTEGDLFLFGNPTFANIDIVKFIEGNSSILAGECAWMTLEAGTRNSVNQATYNESTKTWTSTHGNPTSLPVGCSMLFRTKSNTKSVTLNVTPDMLATNSGQAGGASHVMGLTENKEIAISLRHNSITSASCYISRALLREDAEAADNYVEGEDAEALLMEAAKTRFVIYTTSDDKACAINQITSNTTMVPLAVYSTYTGKISKEYLCFEGDNDYLNEWDLVNLTDGSRTQLYDSLTLTVVMPLDGTIDYVLEHTRQAPQVPTDVDETNSLHNNFNVYTSEGYLFAYSNEDMMDFSIYDASGRLVAAEKNAGQTAQFHLPTGVYMVRANGEVLKTIVK